MILESAEGEREGEVPERSGLGSLMQSKELYKSYNFDSSRQLTQLHQDPRSTGFASTSPLHQLCLVREEDMQRLRAEAPDEIVNLLLELGLFGGSRGLDGAWEFSLGAVDVGEEDISAEALRGFVGKASRSTRWWGGAVQRCAL